MTLAITHIPSPKMSECELTFVSRAPIDYERALRQHSAYCGMLRDCGAEVRTLDVNLEFPDCAFIEDAAVVLDEIAVLGRMGAESRRGEIAGIERELQRYREVYPIEPPATLEGGDILKVGRTLLVGLSTRTNAAGAEALRSIAAQHGYRVGAVPVRGSLHLETAVTALPDGRLLVNPGWVDVKDLHGFNLVRIPEIEPWGANVAIVNGCVCASSAQRETCEMICRLGFDLRTVDIDEFAKAEGGVTCLSLLLEG